jgi:hypothetical protein
MKIRGEHLDRERTACGLSGKAWGVSNPPDNVPFAWLQTMPTRNAMHGPYDVGLVLLLHSISIDSSVAGDCIVCAHVHDRALPAHSYALY